MKKNGIEEYAAFYIRQQCQKGVEEGKMYEKYGLYYFSIPETEWIIADFPKEFDTLIIERLGKTYTFQRNKLVDRFLRKSNKVYKNIEDYYDKYTLRFMLNGKEIYQCYFSDVGYPPKAVELMKSMVNNYGK